MSLLDPDALSLADSAPGYNPSRTVWLGSVPGVKSTFKLISLLTIGDK
jgi:hypothetical protein